MSFRRHLVTTEPANQDGHHVVTLHIGLKNWFPFEEFLQFVVACSGFCLKQSTLYRAEKAQSFTACLGIPLAVLFTEKIVLRDKGKP